MPATFGRQPPTPLRLTCDLPEPSPPQWTSTRELEQAGEGDLDFTPGAGTEGWVDDQIVDANGVIWTEVTAPSGYSVRSRTRNQWLLPDLGLVPCRHGEPVTRGTVETSAQPERSRTRTQVKHAYRMRIRSQCRYEQACAAAAHHTEFVEDGPPPF